MASKELGFDGICKNIKAGKFAPVYILMGEEPFFIDKITDLLIENVLGESERDFNQTILYGGDTNAGMIFNAARRFPVMSEYQLIVVREAQLIKDIDTLDNYVKNPLKSTILVINYKYKTLDGRKKLCVNAEKVGIVFKSEKVKDYKMPAFIESSLKERGIGADAKSIHMLSDYLGNDLNRLHQELDKLSLIFAANGAKRLTPGIIEENIGISKEYNNFELLKSIAAKEVLKANRIINFFEKDPGTAIQSTLAVLFNYFSDLLVCHYSANKTQGGIMAALGLRSEYQTKDYITGLKNFTPMKTFRIISEIRNADARSKGVDNNSLSEGDIMRELLYKILH